MNDPMSIEWLSAEKTSSSTFWMTIETPKLTSSVVSGPRSRVAWMSVRWPR